MLARNERLASLDSRFEDATNRLTIRKDGQIVASGDLETAAGRAAIEDYFTENFQPELKGPPKVLSGRDHSFSDVARKVVSIINLEQRPRHRDHARRDRRASAALPRQSLRRRAGRPGPSSTSSARRSRSGRPG